MQQPVILFDGVCNLCNFFVRFVLKHEIKNDILFVPLQSELAIKILNHYSIVLSESSLETVVFIERKNVHFRSDAAFKILSQIKPPYSWLTVFQLLPHNFNEAIYKWISKNRLKIFGKRNACMVPSENIKNRFPVELKLD